MRRLPRIQTVLDVGCGTGRSTRWFTGHGLVATGIDPSDAMLAEAERHGNEQFIKGDAEQLPFAANEYDLVSFIISLEFVSDPERAIHEAVRVARHGVLLGVQNRHSRLAARRRESGDHIWNRARFFTVSELKRLLMRAMAPNRCSLWWRTTLWPKPFSGSLPLPWGGFIGMIAQTGEVWPNEADLPRNSDANMEP